MEVRKTLTDLGKGHEHKIGCGVDNKEDFIVTPSQLKLKPIQKALLLHTLLLYVRLSNLFVPYIELLRVDSLPSPSAFPKRL